MQHTEPLLFKQDLLGNIKMAGKYGGGRGVVARVHLVTTQHLCRKHTAIRIDHAGGRDTAIRLQRTQDRLRITRIGEGQCSLQVESRHLRQCFKAHLRIGAHLHCRYGGKAHPRHHQCKTTADEDNTLQLALQWQVGQS